MKKVYIKPALEAVPFQIDATGAAACSTQDNGIAISYGEDNCSYDGQFFNDKNCQIDLTGAQDKDTICYHGPESFGIVFISS